MHFPYYFLLHLLCAFFITPTVFTWLRKIPQKLTNRRYFRPVWLWTYANKWGNRELPDVPQMAPRSWGNYYKAAHGLITGAFAESESDRFLYNYLNYYVFSKVCWDVTLDVEAVLAEHHRLKFGPAACEMSVFFDALEQKWMREIVGNWEDSPLGPMMATPSDNKLWLEIYSVSFMKKLDHILCAAKAKVSSGSVLIQ